MHNLPNQVIEVPEVLEGYQYLGTANSATPIIEWVLEKDAGASYHCDDVLTCESDNHTVVIQQGDVHFELEKDDWVLKDAQDKFFRVSNDEFERKYAFYR